MIHQIMVSILGKLIKVQHNLHTLTDLTIESTIKLFPNLVSLGRNVSVTHSVSDSHAKYLGLKIIQINHNFLVYGRERNKLLEHANNITLTFGCQRNPDHELTKGK